MLRAGFSRIEINPSTECSLMGYAFRYTDLPRGNDGVHDPLYARVLVLDDGDKPAALVSVDLCVVPTDLAHELRIATAIQIGTDYNRVILSQHAARSEPQGENNERYRHPRAWARGC